MAASGLQALSIQAGAQPGQTRSEAPGPQRRSFALGLLVGLLGSASLAAVALPREGAPGGAGRGAKFLGTVPLGVGGLTRGHPASSPAVQRMPPPARIVFEEPRDLDDFAAPHGGKSGVATNMVLSRFARLVKANVNELLNNAEDPEKMLNQIVEDMQKELVEFRQAYAEVAANNKRMERQLAEAERLQEEWLKRAKLALEKGDEEAARAALERKNQQEETANSLRAQVQSQSESVAQLFQQMQQLEQKIQEAKAKKDTLKSRAQSAKVSTKINDMMSRTSSSGALDAFNRMEDKVESMEAQAEVSGALSAGTDPSLEKRFKELEAGSKVEDDLAALKGLISGGTTDKPKALAPAAGANPQVDDELQKMKDSLKA